MQASLSHIKAAKSCSQLLALSSNKHPLRHLIEIINRVGNLQTFTCSLVFINTSMSIFSLFQGASRGFRYFFNHYWGIYRAHVRIWTFLSNFRVIQRSFAQTQLHLSVDWLIFLSSRVTISNRMLCVFAWASDVLNWTEVLFKKNNNNDHFLKPTWFQFSILVDQVWLICPVF